jgi:hypothetical protein
MLISGICVVAILATSFNVQGSQEVLALMVAFIASMFYGLIARLMVGLSQAELNHNVDLQRMLTSYFVQVTSVVLVVMGPYSYIAYMAIPWIGVATFSNTLSVLAKFGYLEIHDRNE